jgi:lipopolysaccharide export system permease protein
MKKTITLYVFKEIIGPFSVGLLIFTFIFLTNSILRLTELVVNKGVRLIDILKLILFVMPSFLVFAIPMALLMAALTAFGRLSSDNEITAMKASGISLYELVTPIMILSIICYLLTSIMSIYAEPYGNHAYKKSIYNIAKTKANIGIKERIFNNDFEGLVLYVNEIAVKGKKLKGILVSERRKMEEVQTIVAKEGYIISDPKSLNIALRLIDGSIHRVGKELNTYQRIAFSSYDISLSLGTIIKEKGGFTKRYKEMSIDELQRKIKNLKEKKKKYFHPLRILYEKFSFPFACLVFGLLAVPLGIQSKPSGKFLGFIVSLGVILTYYVLLTGGEIMAKNGKMPLFIAVWAPNFLFGILGLYMLYKTANELPVKLVLWIKGLRSRGEVKNGNL